MGGMHQAGCGSCGWLVRGRAWKLLRTEQLLQPCDARSRPAAATLSTPPTTLCISPYQPPFLIS